MAEFEGKLNLDVETSEIEVNGKFLLTEDELDMVAGGQGPTEELPFGPTTEWLNYRQKNLETIAVGGGIAQALDSSVAEGTHGVLASIESETTKNTPLILPGGESSK